MDLIKGFVHDLKRNAEKEKVKDSFKAKPPPLPVKEAKVKEKEKEKDKEKEKEKEKDKDKEKEKEKERDKEKEKEKDKDKEKEKEKDKEKEKEKERLALDNTDKKMRRRSPARRASGVPNGPPILMPAGAKDEERAKTPVKDEAKKKVKVLPRAANADEICTQWCAATIEKGIEGLTAEFKALQLNKNIDATAFNKPENAGKNRNAEILCCEATRVRVPEDYYHANYVGTVFSSTKFIGPMESTVQTFWAMLIQEKIKAVLMLCRSIEGELHMCAPYFSEETGGSLGIGVYKVFTHEKSALKDHPNIACFKVSVKNTKNPDAQRHHCIVYQWTDWPEFGVPEVSNALIDMLHMVRGSETPVLVHCSEGVSRSGIVALYEEFYELLHGGQKCEDGAKVLCDLRAQRWGSVCTELQYLFVFRQLLHGCLQKKLCDMSQTLLMWYDDYDAFAKKAVNAEKEAAKKT